MTEEGRLIVGRYRLAQWISQGSMGVVWRAHDVRLLRDVAIKQIKLGSTGVTYKRDEAVQRTLREGRIAARLRHPNAVTVYDVVEEEGLPWLVLEYLPSRSLATVLVERGSLPYQEVALIGSRLASALAAAHRAGIVHRDVKPSNVLIGHNGEIKLTDFGISRAAGDVTVTAAGLIAGTPAYLSPEAVHGARPDSPADVFALGATLYAAVSGDPPFGSDDDTMAVMQRIASGWVPPPHNAGPLSAILMSLLKSTPEERPSMTSVRRMLDSVSSGRQDSVLHLAATQFRDGTGIASRGSLMVTRSSRFSLLDWFHRQLR
ncbi:hypothetical protein GCM10011609_84760 [Lentzea pudingi]|uniref:non-specific serine/threonine protein kinase n=1 Tax=Lentzea pudingi TaxID=1789439 RepID=A0ABQ2ISY4_9PSEU|nr:serine/threonine-protein kinase [Lentzea pudingi]GGN28558.1 hypothetical protein GCM10011609_84760 [Lentzea pudingi]